MCVFCHQVQMKLADTLRKLSEQGKDVEGIDAVDVDQLRSSISRKRCTLFACLHVCGVTDPQMWHYRTKPRVVLNYVQYGPHIALAIE